MITKERLVETATARRCSGMDVLGSVAALGWNSSRSEPPRFGPIALTDPTYALLRR